MTEAIVGVGIFFVPCLIVAAREEHIKRIKQRAKNIQKQAYDSYVNGFVKGMEYEVICAQSRRQQLAKRISQQVDQEEARYAKMVG